ncbi:MAG: usg protein [Alphaproteobacteria bacterium]|nr:usg protein [Alphaproteobacteria bacterium]
MADLRKQLADFRLTTAQIYYHMPDHQSLLQEYIWQDYDISPQFPVLKKFLDFWVEEIEGTLHSVYVAKRKLITDSDMGFADFECTLN